MSCHVLVSHAVLAAEIPTEKRPPRARHRRSIAPPTGPNDEPRIYLDRNRNHHSQVRQAPQSPGVSDPAAAPQEAQINQLTPRDNPGCLSAAHPKKVSGISRVDLFDKDT